MIVTKSRVFKRPVCMRPSLHEWAEHVAKQGADSAQMVQYAGRMANQTQLETCLGAIPSLILDPLILNKGSPEFQIVIFAPKTIFQRAKTRISCGSDPLNFVCFVARLKDSGSP